MVASCGDEEAPFTYVLGASIVGHFIEHPVFLSACAAQYLRSYRIDVGIKAKPSPGLVTNGFKVV